MCEARRAPASESILQLLKIWIPAPFFSDLANHGFEAGAWNDPVKEPSGDPPQAEAAQALRSFAPSAARTAGLPVLTQGWEVGEANHPHYVRSKKENHADLYFRNILYFQGHQRIQEKLFY